MDQLIAELMERKVFVRTMGAHFLGRLVAADIWWLKLEQCSWLADPDTSGDEEQRQQEYVLLHGLGPHADIQRYPNPKYLNKGPIEGLTEWDHDLP
ncbi:MAG: hypothetical protein L0Z49_09235 [Actinobacteria bacterium]|nr:hypothetical protein [Actinomycetota bacterium]